MTDLRTTLLRLRYERNMTQKDVANYSCGFLTESIVAALEQGRRPASFNHIRGFCHAFELSYVGLLIGVSLPENPEAEELERIGKHRLQQSRLHSRKGYNG